MYICVYVIVEADIYVKMLKINEIFANSEFL
jgi:hypothetical protein